MMVSEKLKQKAKVIAAWNSVKHEFIGFAAYVPGSVSIRSNLKSLVSNSPYQITPFLSHGLVMGEIRRIGDPRLVTAVHLAVREDSCHPYQTEANAEIAANLAKLILNVERESKRNV